MSQFGTMVKEFLKKYSASLKFAADRLSARIGTRLVFLRPSVLFLVFILNGVLGLVSLSSAQSKSKQVENNVITDKEWIKSFSENFQNEFCNSKEIQVCYEQIRPSCLEFVHSELKNCLKKSKISESSSLDRRYSILGAKLGRCVGREVNKRFLKRKTTESLCQSLLK